MSKWPSNLLGKTNNAYFDDQYNSGRLGSGDYDFKMYLNGVINQLAETTKDVTDLDFTKAFKWSPIDNEPLVNLNDI